MPEPEYEEAEYKDPERCGLAEGGLLCVLAKGHNGGHCFRDVPVLPDNSLFGGGPLYSAFCPYCGSRPMLEGPGCEECGGEEDEDI